MEQALINAAPQLITVGAALLIALAGWGIKVLKRKVNFEAGKAALDEVDRAVQAVVGNLSQTTVENLKAAGADGVWTMEEKAHIKTLAIQNVKSLLSTETTKAANKIVTDLGTYVTQKIEEQVLANKSQ
jgi:hypothetical protein